MQAGFDLGPVGDVALLEDAVVAVLEQVDTVTRDAATLRGKRCEHRGEKVRPVEGKNRDGCGSFIWHCELPGNPLWASPDFDANG